MSDKVTLRRRREGRTDYRQRLGLLKSRKPRLVARRSNRHFSAHLTRYLRDGDETVVNAHSSELEDYGWLGSTGNTSAAYLTGFLLGTRVGDGEAVFDIGMHNPDPGSNLFAVAMGARDAGLDVPLGEDVLPSEERIRGQHVADYAEEGDFSRYEERGLDPADLLEHFEEVRDEISEEAGE